MLKVDVNVERASAVPISFAQIPCLFFGKAMLLKAALYVYMVPTKMPHVGHDNKLIEAAPV